MNQKVEKFILSVTESAPEPGPKPAPKPMPSPTVLATPKSEIPVYNRKSF